MMKIRREEKTLWVVNVILVMILLFMGTLILIRGLAPLEQKPLSKEGDLSVAYFNKKPIYASEWEQELKQKYGQEVLLQMLNHKAVYEEADALDIHVSPDDITHEIKRVIAGYESEEAYYHEMETQLGLSPEEVTAEMDYKLTLEQIAIQGIHITDQQIDAYLEENRDQFEASKQFELSIIKLSNVVDAEEVLDQLDAGAEFAQMAKKHSIDQSSRDKGGRIGAVDWNDPFLPKEMLDAAATLQISNIAGPFRWDDDYVVIQLTDIISEEQEDMKDIRESIRKRLGLNEAMPLTELEAALREKYEAEILADSLTN